MRKNRVGYVILLGCSVAFAYYLTGKAAFIALYTLILLPLFSAAIAFVGLKRLRITQELDQVRAVKGAEIRLFINLHNQSPFLSPYIHFFLDAKKFSTQNGGSEIYSLPPMAKRRNAVPLCCKYRGLYKVGAERVEFHDFFGLFRFKKRIVDLPELTVFPKMKNLQFNLTVPPASMEAPCLSNQRDAENSDIVSSVRVYNTSDSMKKVHWKLSAKRDVLLVKSYENTADCATMIFLDLAKRPLPADIALAREDAVIGAALSVLHGCVKQSIEAELVYFTDRQNRVKISDSQDFERIYTLFASLPFSASQLSGEVMLNLLPHCKKGGNFIVISDETASEFQDALYAARAFGQTVSWIHVISEDCDLAAENLAEKLAEAEIQYYPVL